MKAEVKAALEAEMIDIVAATELTPEEAEAYFLAPAHLKLLAALDAMPDDYTTPTVFGVYWGGKFRPIAYNCKSDLVDLSFEFTDTEVGATNTDLSVEPYTTVYTIMENVDRVWFTTYAAGLQIQPEPEPEVPVDTGE